MCSTACWLHPLHACFSISHVTVGVLLLAFSLFSITGRYCIFKCSCFNGQPKLKKYNNFHRLAQICILSVTVSVAPDTQYWYHFNAWPNVNSTEDIIYMMQQCGIQARFSLSPVHCRWSCTWRGVCPCTLPSQAESQLAPLSSASVSLKTKQTIKRPICKDHSHCEPG